ncbi:MAG: hypothetical protein DRP14_04210, partial [Candidatus Aenigmatarchaeota archaeon]
DSCKCTLANIPTNLQPTEINPTQIVIEWNANGNPAGTYYNLERNGSSIYENTATTYTDSGLICSSKYSYRVRAKNCDNIYTNFTSNTTVWTLPETPILNSTTHTVSAWSNNNLINVTATTENTGCADHYHYKWDTNPTTTVTGADTQWNGSEIQLNAVSDGYWYLHAIAHNPNNDENPDGTQHLGPFKIDTQMPSITIQSPENINYTVTYVDLNYTVTDSGSGVDSCWYSLDSGDNISLPNCQNITLTDLNDGNHFIVVYANDSVGNIGQSSVNFTISTLDLYIIKIFDPNLLVAYEKEQVNTTTKLKINHSYSNISRFNLTDEVPWDFSLDNNSLSVKLEKYNPYSKTDVTNNVTIIVNDLPGQNNTKIEINCSNTSLCFGNYLQENDTIILNYLINSSELEAQENRTTETFGEISDINLNSKNRTINTTISVSNIVLRGYKDLTVDLSNPQNITASIIVKAIGGSLENITFVDYLPEGATIYNRQIYWFNGTYNELTEGDDFNVTISNVTLPGGYLGKSYQYNFTATGTTWPGYLQDNESIIINYTFVVLGGGHWDLPAIISGYDPSYQKHIKTEMYADANIPSFDVELKMYTHTVKPGEYVRALLELTNVGGPRAKVDVEITYSVKTMEGKLIVEGTKTIAVVEEKKEDLELLLPEDIKPGIYTFESFVTYTKREAIATENFIVKKEQIPGFLNQYIIYIILIIFTFLGWFIPFKKR